MENFHCGYYLIIILIGVIIFNDRVAVAQNSATITQVEHVTNGASSSKIIECAFQLWKNLDKAYARIAEGTDVCELLNRPSLTSLNFFKEGYEYFEELIEYQELQMNTLFKENVVHNIFSAVKLGDKFTFEMRKSGVARMIIEFIDNSVTTILKFSDNSAKLFLNDIVDIKTGTPKQISYPFTDFKVYKIDFEVFDSKWQIYVDNESAGTFKHRHNFTMVQKIIVQVGHQLSYISKAIHPRN